MSDERVRITIEDGVAQVTMVRAEKHNALDEHMFRALHAAADRLTTEHGVRAVVLHGEGKSFCSGLDVLSFMTGEASMTIDEVLEREPGRTANFAQRVATDWADVPVPVIAAIHGNCFGGGIQIALGTDIRIAAPDAKLSVMEIKWGLIPDMGITRSLPRLVGIDVAKELTWTGRMLSGAEASELGVVTRCAEDPLAEALALAREIASKSPDAIQRAKQLFDASWTADAETTLSLEAQLQTELMGTPNQMEAVRAGFAKEAGTYTDPERAHGRSISEATTG